MRHHHTHREPRSDGDGRLHGEHAAHHLFTDLAKALRTSLPQRLHQRVLIIASARASFGSNAEQGGEHGGFEQHAPVVVDLILQPGIARGVSTGLAFEHDGATVGQDEPGPGEQDAGLAEVDLGVVFADQFGTLRDEQGMTRQAVIDILR